MIAIIDYRAGNLTSVARALRFLGQDCEVTDDPGKIAAAQRVIFPGVGAAGEAMANLRAKGLDACVRDVFQAGKPILGICLGTQIIFDYSEEDDTACLGIIPGRVRKFPEGMEEGGQRLKIPHMGWNRINYRGGHPVFRGLPEGAEFYFVHSYYPEPADGSAAVGRARYGMEFCAAVAHRNLAAVQFHAEKSGRIGLRILENFCGWDGKHAE